MTELEQLICGDGAAAPPAFILEGLTSEQVHRTLTGSPRNIYEELWHIAFWQQISIDWINGIETPYPDHADQGFPSRAEIEREAWVELRERFFRQSRQAAEAAQNLARLDRSIRCTSRPGQPVRIMTVREQLENLAAHNAYHFGRIVLLRQLLSAWPPPSGGFTW
ncbi:MAG: DinB family protein [Terracidiphilus sp.]